MPKPKVYLETSVISYLTARPNRDIVKMAKQELTREWWATSRHYFDLYVSRPVLDEIRAGDPKAARLRMAAAAAGIPELIGTDKVDTLFAKLLAAKIVPEKATLDAYHIAAAAAHGMAYLLTWNCAHINKATNRPKIMEIITEAGYNEVTIATPEELRRRPNVR